MKKVELVQAMFTQEEIAAINTKNIKLEEENERLQSSLDYANRDREDMHNKIIELWNKRESQRNMNYKLRKENKNMKLVLEQMENTCKDYLNDRDTLREENSTLKANIEFLHQCLDDRDKSIELLKKGLEEAYQEWLEQWCKHQ